MKLISGRRRHQEAVEAQAHPATTAERGDTKKAQSEADRGREVEDTGPMNAALLVGVVGLPAVIDIAGSEIGLEVLFLENNFRQIFFWT